MRSISKMNVLKQIKDIEKDVILEYHNTHQDNKNKDELIRLVKKHNGVIMAREGWQYADHIINKLISKLLREFNYKEGAK